MRVSILLNTIGAVALISLAACGQRQVTRPSPVFPPECKILPPPTDTGNSITVALFDAINPEHAPRARNAGEKLLFHHLYETLIVVDCLGEIRPGLAESWVKRVGGRLWTFELRESARFWDGTPVTARDVASCWRHAADDPMTSCAVIDSTNVVGDRTLHVYFKHPHREVPCELSALEFAVAKPSGYSHWPLGSGPYRIASRGRMATGTSKSTITIHSTFGVRGPVIQFLETSAFDARDLLEGAIDVIITADPAVIDYAADRPRFNTISLPWDRTYVLLSTSRVREIREGGKLAEISPDLSDGLARDAVRSDARGNRPPAWWDDLSGCGELSVPVYRFLPVPQGAHSSSGLRRILYDADDGIARDLAERIVALAATDPAASPEATAITSAIPGLTGGSVGVVAEGVTEGDLAWSLRDGEDFAYVVPIRRRPHDPCDEARRLTKRARWLAALEADFPRAMVPLVDTRVHVIANSDKVGLIVDWYGNILITNEKSRVR